MYYVFNTRHPFEKLRSKMRINVIGINTNIPDNLVKAEMDAFLPLRFFIKSPQVLAWLGARDFMFLYLTPPPATEFCSRDNFRTTFRISLIFFQDWWPWPFDYLIRFWLITVMNFRTWNLGAGTPAQNSDFCPRFPPPAHLTPATRPFDTRLIFVKIPLLRPPPPPPPHTHTHTAPPHPQSHPQSHPTPPPTPIPPPPPPPVWDYEQLVLLKDPVSGQRSVVETNLMIVQKQGFLALGHVHAALMLTVLRAA